MSGLTRWLVWDRERPDLDGGAKTPAFIDVPVHPSMDQIIVSKPNGGYRTVENNDDSDEEDNLQRTGAFELKASGEAEDEEQARIARFLYEEGARRNWGNVVLRDDLGPDFFDDVTDYFDTFHLDVSSIHAGLSGCHCLIEAGLVEPSDGELDSNVDTEYLSELMAEEYAVGKVKGKPLFFNEPLGDLTLFSADQEYVGIGVRIQHRVAVIIHNPERGVVVAKTS